MPAAKNVLFISRQRIVGSTNGSSAYLIDLARSVRAIGMVPHLIQPSPTVSGRWPVLSMRPEMNVFASHRIRGLLQIGRHYVALSPRVYGAIVLAAFAAVGRRIGLPDAWSRDRPLPYTVAIAWNARDHAWLRRRARPISDIAIADYMFNAEGFADLPETTLATAIIMHDLFHARAGGSADSVTAVSRSDEIAMLQRGDAVIAIQAIEAKFVRKEVPGVDIIVAPFAAQLRSAAQPGDPDRLLFVGSNTAPNTVGLEWFFANVWPAIRAARPDAILDVAGGVARAFPGGGPAGVTFLGLVPDLEPLYARTGVVISPLTFGSGLKIKLIEALANGKAVVATPVTMQGVEQPCQGAALVAEDAACFAHSVLTLLSDDEKRRNLGEAALSTARRHFSADRCYGAFTAWLQSQGAQR